MPRILFTTADGMRREIDAPAGITLMETAVQNGVPGIIALCGGACACGTCHVYVDPAWMNRVDPLEEMEKAVLECVSEPRANSRLSCQIHIAKGLDGLPVTIPHAQGGV